MKATDAFRSTMQMGQLVMKTYIADLNDAELMMRPGPGCNHLAWQLGHLIASEVSLVNMICPGQGAELPAGFVEKHSKENIGVDDPKKFCTKQEYLDLMDKVSAASAKAIEKLTDAQLAAPAPEKMQKHFPTMMDVVTLIATHPMMHVGQIVPVRRRLGKPVVI